MSRGPERWVADFDSAAGMLKALSRFLHGRDFPRLGMSPLLVPPTRAVNLLPRSLRDQVYAWSGFMEAIPQRELDRVRAGAVSAWAAGHYPRRRYPAAMIGSSNGALVHLCAALGIPWLPQTFLMPVRRRAIPIDDSRAALEAGIGPANRLLSRNPDLQLHHMHDPNQDRLMARHMTYFRVKRRNLGEEYAGFLADALEPGATIYVAECRRGWPVTRIGPRHLFQHGAVGGATDDEYFRGGPRVERFLAAHGVPRARWDPPEPDARAPEAEWGFEPALGEDVEAFARARGHRVVRIAFEDPEDASPLVADLYRWWYRRLGWPDDRLLVESFILLDPFRTLRLGAVPFWMVFNTERSADALERWLGGTDPFDFIHLMLFAHGTDSIGLPPMDRWRAILARARRAGAFAGVDPDAHPRDFAVFARYGRALRAIPSRRPMPPPLTAADLERFLDAHGHRHPVTWTGRPGTLPGPPR